MNYIIKPIGIGYYWMKYFLLIGIVIFNLILYSESAPFQIFKMANSVFVAMSIFIYFYMKMKKNKIEVDFKRIFEIQL